MSMENAYEAHVVDPNVSLSDDFRSSSPAGELMLKLGNGETLNETERSATREAFLYDPSFLTYLETQECTPGDPEIDRIIADYAYWLINLESTLGEHAVHVSDNSDLPYAEESSNDLNSSARHQVDKDEMRRLPDITQETMPPRLPITQNPELYDTRQQNAYQLLEMLFPTDFSVPPQTDIYSPIGLTSKVYLHPQDAGRVSDQVGTTPLFKNPAIPSDHTVSQESPVDLDAYYLDFLNSHVFQPPTSPPEETHSHSHEDAPDLRNEIVVKEPEVSSSDLTPLSGSSTDDETTTDNWKSPSESDDVEGDPSYDTKNKKRKRNQSDVVLKHQRVFGGHKGHSQVSSTRKSRGRKRNESTRRMRQVKEEHVEKRAVKSASEAEQHADEKPPGVSQKDKGRSTSSRPLDIDVCLPHQHASRGPPQKGNHSRNTGESTTDRQSKSPKMPIEQDQEYDGDTDQFANRKLRMRKERCTRGGKDGEGCGRCWRCVYEWGSP